MTLGSGVGWVLLTALAFLGNVLHLPLFFNVDILFGSIFTLVVLHYYGWVPAVLSALIGASYTVILWLHPYAVIILVAETLIIGLFYRRWSHNLMILATGFWLVIGMPLVLLFYLGILDLASQTAVVVMLKQAINGIFNALLASLLISVLQSIAPSLEPRPRRSPFAFAQVIFLVVVAFVLIPAMVILVVAARNEMDRVEEEIQSRLELTSFSTKQAVNAFLAENFHTLSSLAGYARPDDPDQMGVLREEMSLLKSSDEDFVVIAIVDSTGRIVAAQPAELTEQTLASSDLSEWPYFARISSGMHGLASNALLPPGSRRQIVLLGAPIVHSDTFSGAASGILDAARIRDVLHRTSGNWNVTATIVDGNGHVLASTSSSDAPFAKIKASLPQPEEHLYRNLFVRFPPLEPNESIMSRWREAEFMTLDRMGHNSEWLLMLDAPTAPYHSALMNRYQSTLLLMMAVIIATTLLSAFISKTMLASLSKLTIVSENLPDKVTAQEDLEWPQSNIFEIDTLINCFRLTSEHIGESFRTVQDANAQLMVAKQEAEAASKTKSQFLANVSHDLRTPLNGILGYAQILAHDESLDARTREAIGIIEKSGNHLLNLINDILDISRIEAQKLTLSKESFPLRHFLEDLADIIRLQVRKKGLSLNVEFGAEMPHAVTGDEKRLRQILLNLLTNAVKFTNDGLISFRASYANGDLHAEIEDTGMGIPLEQQREIFSPFRQLTKHVQSEEGTGLGLAIVERLVVAMGGTIALESEPGNGSRFSVDVPLATSDAQPELPQTTATIAGYEGPQVLVLVVDDKWENRSVVRTMLEPLGFRVTEAANGAEGLDLMRRDRPDIVFMDLVMPVLDGFGAIRTIRDIDKKERPPVVALSASVANTIRQECLRVGFDDFLPKPFEERELLELIERHTRVVWKHTVRTPAPAGRAERNEAAVPEPALLHRLAETVASGNIKHIMEAADQIERDRPEFADFAHHVRSLAQEFQVNRLSDYLNRLQHDRVEPEPGDE